MTVCLGITRNSSIVARDIFIGGSRRIGHGLSHVIQLTRKSLVEITSWILPWTDTIMSTMSGTVRWTYCHTTNTVCTTSITYSAVLFILHLTCTDNSAGQMNEWHGQISKFRFGKYGIINWTQFCQLRLKVKLSPVKKYFSVPWINIWQTRVWQRQWPHRRLSANSG